MPNNDYIKRSDAATLISQLPAYHGSDGAWVNQKDVLDTLNAIPAADVEPKRYAEWINPAEISVCSNCGKAAPYDVEGDIIMYWPDLNFCPYCGCKMNEEPPKEKKDD